MMRQMGAGQSIAGNVAFKENATSVADRGTEIARAVDHGQPPRSPPTMPRRRVSLELDRGSVDPTTFTGPTRESRLLTDAGAPRRSRSATRRRSSSSGCAETPDDERHRPAQRCSDSLVANGAVRGGGGYPSVLASTSITPYFRVTTRVVRAPQHDQLHAGLARLSGVRTNQENIMKEQSQPLSALRRWSRPSRGPGRDRRLTLAGRAGADRHLRRRRSPPTPRRSSRTSCC